MGWRQVTALLRESAADFLEDEALSRAAALAFYAALGLAPAVLLVLAGSAWLGDETTQALLDEIQALVGAQAAQAVDMVVRSARDRPASGTISTIVGLAMVLFSVSGIFAELQTALNRIWEVELPPQAGWWSWLRTRLLSLGMVGATLFLLLVSLVVSAAIALIVPESGLGLLDLVITLGVFVLLFAMIFKFLPDAAIDWRDVWMGSAVTALLFLVGKQLIGLYLGTSGVASSYGAAGALAALLIWVYYSAVIVLFGAELTQVWARQFGAGIRPCAWRRPHHQRSNARAAAASSRVAKWS